MGEFNVNIGNNKKVALKKASKEAFVWKSSPSDTVDQYLHKVNPAWQGQQGQAQQQHVVSGSDVQWQRAIVQPHEVQVISCIVSNPTSHNPSNCRPKFTLRAGVMESGESDQEYPKTQIVWKTEKLIQNAKTQKRLEICQN